MLLKTQAIISEFYDSPKSGKQYVSFVDLQDGGQFKVVFEGQLQAKEGEIIEFDARVKPRIIQGGGVTLTFVGGVVNRKNGNFQDKGGEK